MFGKGKSDLPSYTVVRSARAKSLRLTVHPGGDVVLTLPCWVNAWRGEGFVRARAAWLSRTIERMQKVKLPGPSLLPRRTRAHYLAHREAARALVERKLVSWNVHYHFAYNRVAIRNSKSRWGSASMRGNLNFNYRILFLPEHLQDYLIVHELCHLQQHNHSRNFWSIVAKTIPQYREYCKQIRSYC